jgi:hypothetical protein
MSHGDPYRPPGEARQHSDPKTDARIALSRERTKLVVAARVRGLSWAQVGLEVGISRAQAHKLWKSEMEDRPIEGLEEKRALLLDKLERRERDARVEIAEARQARKRLGDVTRKNLPQHEHERKRIHDARAELDRVHEMQAKIQGTFAPTKHQVMGGDDGGGIQVEIVTVNDVLARIAAVAGEKSQPVAVPAAVEPTAATDTEAPEGANGVVPLPGESDDLDDEPIVPLEHDDLDEEGAPPPSSAP